MPYAKLVIFTPLSHAAKIREVLGKSGCGHIGNYDCCSFSVKGTGRFRPNKGAKPFLGQIDKLEEITEERIETIVETDKLKEVLAEIKKVHPYEEPAIDIYPLLNDQFLK